MRRMTTARRGGFTLLELLTVIAILAVLAALGTAAFLRARKGQEERASEATVNTLRGLFTTSWQAVLDDAKQDQKAGRIPTAVTTFAGSDPERVLAVWTYCKLKNEFPTTIQEACNPVCVPTPDPSNPAGFPSQYQATTVLTPKSVFTAGFKVVGRFDVTGKPAADEATERTRTMRESAACLYWALTNKSVRGQNTEAGNQPNGQLPQPLELTFVDAGGTAGAGSVPGTTFRDAWGLPVGFLRCGYSAEVDDVPYAVAKPKPAGTVWLRDPIDPRGTLVATTGGWTAQHLDAFWKVLYPLATDGKFNLGVSPARALSASQHAILPLPTPVSPAYPANPYPTFRSPTLFPSYPRDVSAPNSPRNWVPTLVSAGGDKELADSLGQSDDILSYRLAREGNKGN